MIDIASAPILSDETANEIRLFLVQIDHCIRVADQLWFFDEYFQRLGQQPDLFDDMGKYFEDEVPF